VLIGSYPCPLYGGLDVKRKIVPQATRPFLASANAFE
jgi:hypothetical protein